MSREKKLSLPRLDLQKGLDQNRKLSYNSVMGPYRKSSLQSATPQLYVDSKQAVMMDGTYFVNPTMTTSVGSIPYSNNNYTTGFYSASQSLDVRPRRESKLWKDMRRVSSTSKESRTLSVSSKSLRPKQSRKMGRAEQSIAPFPQHMHVLPDVYGAVGMNPAGCESMEPILPPAPPMTQSPKTVTRRKKSQIDRIDTNSSDMQYMISLLDQQLTISEPKIHRLPEPPTPQPDQQSTASGTDMLNGLTPPPQYVLDYGKHLERFQTPPPEERECRTPGGRTRKHSQYRPKQCWCNRCQIMYRLHKESDESLDLWGDYPCHQF